MALSVKVGSVNADTGGTTTTVSGLSFRPKAGIFAAHNGTADSQAAGVSFCVGLSDGANPRYFTDGSGKAILLAGDHTWYTLQDSGYSDPPLVF